MIAHRQSTSVNASIRERFIQIFGSSAISDENVATEKPAPPPPPQKDTTAVSRPSNPDTDDDELLLREMELEIEREMVREDMEAMLDIFKQTEQSEKQFQQGPPNKDDSSNSKQAAPAGSHTVGSRPLNKLNTTEQQFQRLSEDLTHNLAKMKKLIESNKLGNIQKPVLYLPSEEKNKKQDSQPIFYPFQLPAGPASSANVPPCQKKARIAAKPPIRKPIDLLRDIVRYDALTKVYSLDFPYNQMELADIKEIVYLLYDRISHTEIDTEPTIGASIITCAVNFKWNFDRTEERAKFLDYLQEKLSFKLEPSLKSFALCTKRNYANSETEVQRFLNVMRFIGELYNERLLSLPFIKLCVMELQVALPNVEVNAANLHNENAVIATLILIQTIHHRLNLEDPAYLSWLNSTINEIAMNFGDAYKRERIAAEQKKTKEICEIPRNHAPSPPNAVDQPGTSKINSEDY